MERRKGNGRFGFFELECKISFLESKQEMALDPVATRYVFNNMAFESSALRFLRNIK